jgi:uncharacterized protein (DUF433 family)
MRERGRVAQASLPPVRVPHPHVECRDDVMNRSPCVRGTRVPVRRLWSWHRRGTTIETLLKRYPQLGPAKVLDALAFAYDNEDLVEADLARENAALDSEQIPKDPKQGKLPF